MRNFLFYEKFLLMNHSDRRNSEWREETVQEFIPLSHAAFEMRTHAHNSLNIPPYLEEYHLSFPERWTFPHLPNSVWHYENILKMAYWTKSERFDFFSSDLVPLVYCILWPSNEGSAVYLISVSPCSLTQHSTKLLASSMCLIHPGDASLLIPWRVLSWFSQTSFFSLSLSIGSSHNHISGLPLASQCRYKTYQECEAREKPWVIFNCSFLPRYHIKSFLIFIWVIPISANIILPYSFPSMYLDKIRPFSIPPRESSEKEAEKGEYRMSAR